LGLFLAVVLYITCAVISRHWSQWQFCRSKNCWFGPLWFIDKGIASDIRFS